MVVGRPSQREILALTEITGGSGKKGGGEERGRGRGGEEEEGGEGGETELYLNRNYDGRWLLGGLVNERYWR